MAEPLTITQALLVGIMLLIVVGLILLKEVEENIEDLIHVYLFGKSKKFKELNP